MTSSMRWPRSSRALVSPSPQRSASTRLLLPLPLGPTIAVMPRSNSTSLRDANVLKPETTMLRSLIRSVSLLPHGRGPRRTGGCRRATPARRGEALQRIVGGCLLRGLLGVTSPGSGDAVAEHHLGGVLAAVAGPPGRDHPVVGRVTGALLGHFLQLT